MIYYASDTNKSYQTVLSDHMVTLRGSRGTEELGPGRGSRCRRCGRGRFLSAGGSRCIGAGGA